MLDEHGKEIQQFNGQVRVGKGFPKNTVRRSTMHSTLFMQQEAEYKVDFRYMACIMIFIDACMYADTGG